MKTECSGSESCDFADLMLYLNGVTVSATGSVMWPAVGTGPDDVHIGSSNLEVCVGVQQHIDDTLEQCAIQDSGSSGCAHDSPDTWPHMVGWCRGPNDEKVEGRLKDFVDAEFGSSGCASYCLAEASCIGYAYRATVSTYADHRCIVYGPGLREGLPVAVVGAGPYSEWHASQEDGEWASAVTEIGGAGGSSEAACRRRC